MTRAAEIRDGFRNCNAAGVHIVHIADGDQRHLIALFHLQLLQRLLGGSYILGLAGGHQRSDRRIKVGIAAIDVFERFASGGKLGIVNVQRTGTLKADVLIAGCEQIRCTILGQRGFDLHADGFQIVDNSLNQVLGGIVFVIIKDTQRVIPIPSSLI